MSNRPLTDGDLEPHAYRHDAPPDPGPPPDPIRIALLAPPVISVDAAAPGGLLHLARLAAGLADRGHQVTLIGAGTAGVAGLDCGGFELIDTDPTQRSVDGPDPEPGERGIADRVHSANITMILNHLHPDVVGDHTHTSDLHRGSRPVPTAVTIYHRRPFELFGEQSERLPTHVHLVAISEYQRRRSRCWPWQAVIPPAIPLQEYPLSVEHGGPALFLRPRAPVDDAAIWLDAGIALAAAHRARVPIVLAGTHHRPDAAVDLDELLAREPLGPDDRLLMRMDARQRRELLAGARCLVAPLLLDPPCSLEVLEALAVGTPVIGVRETLGAELVRPQASGLLVDVDRLVELPAAIGQAAGLDPKSVRDQAAPFDLPVMARAYEALFARLIEARP